MMNSSYAPAKSLANFNGRLCRIEGKHSNFKFRAYRFL